jgi:hypothetical protein
VTTFGGTVHRAREALSAVVRALGVWGTLAGLGLAPTASALFGILAAVTGSNTALWIAFVVSFGANVVLVVAYWRLRSRIRRAVRGITASGIEMSTKAEQAKWLSVPGELGSIVLPVPDLEIAWGVLLTKAREVGEDAALVLQHIELGAPPNLQADGWSEEAQVTFTVGTTVGSDRGGWLSPWKRAPYPWQRKVGAPPLWRTDGTWSELLRKAWARERPFKGTVYLSVNYAGTDGDTIGTWLVEFQAYDGRFHHPGRKYHLEDGALVGPA